MKRCFAIVLLASGCIGASIVDENAMSTAGRAGMVTEFEDAAFSVYAFPNEWANVDESFVPFLHDTLNRYAVLFGATPKRKITLYLHTQASYGAPNADSAGTTHFDEFAFDLICCSLHAVAHEMGHLVTYDRVGGQARAFLNEGMAEYLADRNEQASDSVTGYSPVGLVPDLACGAAWDIADVFSTVGWWDNESVAYPIAALFTAIAIERTSLERYLDGYYVDAIEGTSSDGDTLLAKFANLDFAAMKSQIIAVGCGR